MIPHGHTAETSQGSPAAPADRGRADWYWPDVSEATFERYNRLLGQHVVVAGSMRWRRIRPFFFAPLLPFDVRATATIQAPPSSWCGGLQYAVPAAEPPNSCIRLSMFRELASYSLSQLDYNRRRQIRIAAQKIEIRPVDDLDTLIREGHRVYCDFYERTRYSYGVQRRDPVFFRRWAEAVLDLPGLVILGGYVRDCLRGVSISMRVGEVLIYATYFCDTESLRMGISDLMLHAVRAAAASSGDAQAIYVGSFKGRKDDFYALRGAQCVKLPARLQLNPLARAALKALRPQVYAKLLGDFPEHAWADVEEGRCFGQT